MSHTQAIQKIAIIGTPESSVRAGAAQLPRQRTGRVVRGPMLHRYAGPSLRTLRQGSLGRHSSGWVSAPGGVGSRAHLLCRSAEPPWQDGLIPGKPGPERIDFRRSSIASWMKLLPADVIIASSSSGLTMSEIQSDCRLHPERCVQRASG